MSGSINELVQSYFDTQVNGYLPVTSLTNASSVSNGSTYDAGKIALAVCVQITSSAVLTAGTIVIQGSIDNVNWADIRSVTAATDFTGAITKMYSQQAGNFGTSRYWRVAITTALTGGTITAKIVASP